jgi:predicted CopG family antitoxin
MRATTIKIEDPLLSELEKYRKGKQSVTALAKEMLERDLKRMKMIEAGRTYAALLQSDAEEREFLDEWAAAPLEQELRAAKTRTHAKPAKRKARKR